MFDRHFLKDAKKLTGSEWPGGRIAGISYANFEEAVERQGLDRDAAFDGRVAVSLSDALAVRRIGYGCSRNGKVYESQVLARREGCPARLAAWWGRVKVPLAMKVLTFEGRLYRIPECGDIPKYSLTNLILGPVYNVI